MYVTMQPEIEPPTPRLALPAAPSRTPPPAPPRPAPFPAPPLRAPSTSPDGRPPEARPSTRREHRPPEVAGLDPALAAARELTLTTVRQTRFTGPGVSLELASDLRRTTAAVALGLEARTARSLIAALRAVWRAGDLIDRAEREGLLDLDQAIELLVSGSRVEVALVAFLRRCGVDPSRIPRG